MRQQQRFLFKLSTMSVLLGLLAGCSDVLNLKPRNQDGSAMAEKISTPAPESEPEAKTPEELAANDPEEKNMQPEVYIPKYLRKGKPCEYGDEIYKDKDRVTYYNEPSVRNGMACVSEVRICHNGKLDGSFKYKNCVVRAPGPPIPVAGDFEGVFEIDGELYVRGWACIQEKEDPVKIVIASSSKTFPEEFAQSGVIFKGMTDRVSEVAISQACKQPLRSQTNRFNVKVSPAQRIQFAGRYLTAYIVKPDGSTERLEKRYGPERYLLQSNTIDQASSAPIPVESPEASKK